MNNQSEDLKQLYQIRFAKLDEYRNQVWEILCRDYFSRYIPAGATVLDVGAGWGEFINNIEARIKFAMDMNSSTGERLDSGVTFLHQDCSEPWDLASNSLDVIFTSNFLEHLSDRVSIERIISEAWRCLRGGGCFISIGPNIKYVAGEYWDFWDHKIPLTERSVAEVMKMKGFAVDICLSRFLPYSMSNGNRPRLSLVKLYLKLPLLWRLLGKQFLVIGYKPKMVVEQ